MDPIVFSEPGIRKLLKAVKPFKAPEPYGIHSILLRNCADSLGALLPAFFQMSYDTGTIPYDWSAANVTPVPIGGHASDPSEYHPIALLSQVLKLHEHVQEKEKKAVEKKQERKGIPKKVLKGQKVKDLKEKYVNNVCKILARSWYTLNKCNNIFP